MTISVQDLDVPTLTFDGDEDAVQRELVELRDAGHWIARGMFGHTLLTYEDCVAVLRDKRFHNLSGRIPELMGIEDTEFLGRRRVSILSAEGDVHTRLRRLVATSFSPRAADRLRPIMRDVVNGLLDAVTPTGRADVVADLCDPYPIPIICELLGAPKKDWQLFSRWAEDVLRIFNANLVEELPLIMKAQDELDEYTRALIADRRNSPADDLLTSMIAAEEAGDRLSTDELVMMTEAVIVAGTDTTRNQLGLSLALFAEHPDQWALLAEQPELAPRAVEECMRYFGAVRGTGRFASEDIVYKDVLFPAGSIVMPALALANRDGAVFTDPDRFDITREPSGQPQLTFGSGIHYCLGAALARAELQEALPILAQRLPNMRIDGAITYKPSTVGIFGAQHFPITFDPTPALAEVTA
jgi:cytochrome P450